MKKSLFVSTLFACAFLYGHVVDPGEDSADDFNNDEFWNKDNYEEREELGFKIYVYKETLESDPDKTEAAYDIVVWGLTYMRHRMYVATFDKLADAGVKIIINDLGDNGGANYHPDYLGWSEFRRKSITFAKLEGSIKHIHWYPGVLIHEIAHAFHDLFLPNGFDNEVIIEWYDKAVASGKYEAVNTTYSSFRSGREKKRAYALTNEREFFAEMSEALWLRNNYEPFTIFEVFNDKTLTGWCEDDMSVSVHCQTNPNYRYNPVWNAWWRYGGPHETIWFYETLDQDEDTNTWVELTEDDPEPTPFWLDLDI